MKMHWLAGFGLSGLLGVGIWFLQGCGTPGSCLAINCNSSTRFNFEPAMQLMGEYEFRFQLHSGETITCAATLPQPDAQSLICTSSQGFDTRYLELHQVDGELKGVRLNEGSRSVVFIINRNDEEISRTTHEPRPHYIGGDECSDDWAGCRQPEVEVRL